MPQARSSLGEARRGRLGADDLQVSRWSDRTQLSFTMNLAFESQAVKERLKRPFDSDRPPAEWDCEFRQRVAAIMPFDPPQTDHWWQLDDVTDDEEVGKNVEVLLRDRVIPHLHAISSNVGLLAYLDSDRKRMWPGEPILAELRRAVVDAQPR